MTKNTRRLEFKLGRTGLILFITGFSVMLFVFFLLGVTVGKNIDTYPEKIARFVPDKIIALFSRLPDFTGPALVAREDQRLERPEPAAAAAESTPDAPAKPDAETKDTASELTAFNKDLSTDIQTPAHQQKQDVLPDPPAPTPTKEKAPARFQVQVVSYREKGKAKALVEKISDLGFSARFEATKIPDKGKWYRVWMGEFQSRREAQIAIDSVSQKIRGLNCVIRPVE